jgi:hypothetical protein
MPRASPLRSPLSGAGGTGGDGVLTRPTMPDERSPCQDSKHHRWFATTTKQPAVPGHRPRTTTCRTAKTGQLSQVRESAAHTAPRLLKDRELAALSR